MRKFSKKQYLVAGVAAAAVIGLGTGTAIAYWSSTGSGTGTATTATGNAGVNITDDSSGLNAMYPGDSEQTVNVTVTNKDASQKVYVNAVQAYLTVAQEATPPAGTCDASDYLLNGISGADSTHPVLLTWPTNGEELAAGADDTTSLTLQFNDKNSLQDACQGATVTIHYSSN